MSEGPIKRERLATTVPRITIPNTERVCAQQPGTLKAMCGRKAKSLTASSDPKVTCPDCLAAIRADAEAAS